MHRSGISISYNAGEVSCRLFYTICLFVLSHDFMRIMKFSTSQIWCDPSLLMQLWTSQIFWCGPSLLMQFWMSQIWCDPSPVDVNCDCCSVAVPDGVFCYQATTPVLASWDSIVSWVGCLFVCFKKYALTFNLCVAKFCMYDKHLLFHAYHFEKT